MALIEVKGVSNHPEIIADFVMRTVIPAINRLEERVCALEERLSAPSRAPRPQPSEPAAPIGPPASMPATVQPDAAAPDDTQPRRSRKR